MRFPVSLLILGVFVVGTVAAQAAQTDQTDASCAATFTALSQSARAQGLPSQEFNRMAAIAVRHGGSAAASDVAGLSLTELQARVVNCQARYDGKGGDMRMAAID
jgi:hypothetical protein